MAEARTLYVVATPLGHLRDITLRALDLLRTVSVIAAEDTRQTSVLLRRYGIATSMLSLHQHNELARAEMLAARLARGDSIALVTDAGTPAVSDPGARLVAAVRSRGFPVVPVPGPNAAIAAISAAGLEAERFVFLGFLPTTPKARTALLAAVGRLDAALVVYEAPHRIRATLAALAEQLPGTRMLTVARELTKRFETIAVMPLASAVAWLDEDANHTRGEFVLVVDAPTTAPAEELTAADERWLAALAQALPPSQAARIAAAATGMPRDVLYERVQHWKPGP